MPTKKGKKKGGGKKKVKLVVSKKAKKMMKKLKKPAKVGLSVMRTVSAPVAKSAVFRQKGPNLNGGKSFRIRNREMLVTVDAGLAFDLYRYQNQPGVDITFPWLSQVAVGFREYRFRKLVFHYEPNCSSSSAGALIMVPLYNADDLSPTSVPQALDMKGAVNVPIWQRASISFSGQKFIKNLFVRTSSTSSSLLLTDFGAFVFILDNVPEGRNLGKIIVEYDVDFFIPIRTSGISSGYGASYAHGSVDVAVLAGDCFQELEYTLTPNGFLSLVSPPMPKELYFFGLGNSNATPLLLVQNMVQFDQPGVYVFGFTAEYSVIPIPITAAHFLVVGATLFSAFISLSQAPVDNDGFSFSFVVQTYTPRATVQMIVDLGTLCPLDNTKAFVSTVNNAVFRDYGMYAGPLQVMSLSNKIQAIKKGVVSPSFFESKDIRVLRDEDFKSFQKDGKLPARSASEVLERYKALERDLASLKLDIDSKEEEDEDLQEIPLTPGPREEVKQLREPSVAPVAAAARSGTGSYLGAFMSKKLGDK